MWYLIIIAVLVLIVLIQTYRIYSWRERNVDLIKMLSYKDDTIFDQLRDITMYKTKIKEDDVIKSKLKDELSKCLHRDKSGKFVKL